MRVIGRFKFSTFAAAIAVLLTVGSVQASVPGAPQIFARKTNDDSARIIFNWPKIVNFKISQADRVVELRFDAPMSGSLNEALWVLYPTLQDVSLKDNNETVVLTFDKPYDVRSFHKGRVTGIDISGLSNPAPSVKAANMLAAIEPAAGPKATTPTPKPTPRPMNTLVTTTAPEAKAPVETMKDAPAAQANVPMPKERPAEKTAAAPVKTEAAPVTTSATPAPEKTPAMQAAETTVPASEETVTAPTQAAAETPEKPVTASAPETPVAPTTPKAEPIEKTATTAPAPTNVSGPTLKVGITPMVQGVILSFPWESAVSAAVFNRGNYVWVVFGQERKVDLQLLGTISSPSLQGADQIVSAGHTVLRLKVSDDTNTKVNKPAGTEHWELTLLPKTISPSDTVLLARDGRNVVLSAERADASFTLTDPDIGDEIIITPFFTAKLGIYPEHRFPEGTLLATAQGMALVKRADGVNVAQENARLVLKGLSFSEDALPSAALVNEVSAADPSKTLFPYEAWRVKNPEDYLQLRRTLFDESVQSTGIAANMARLKLAQMSIASGEMIEALGYLKRIEDTDPAFYISAKLNALAGLANFMLYRVYDAEKNFNAPELAGFEEINLWKSASAALLGRVAEDGSSLFDYLAYEERYIRAYPPDVRGRLAVLAADVATARQDYASAQKILDSIKGTENIGSAQKYADFLRASVAAGTGQMPTALEIWNAMANDLSDRFVRARAEYTLINLDLQNRKITEAEAIKRLEALRIVWRGDSFEMNLLMQLGRMYLKQGDYINGLRTLREVVTVFPDTPEATQAALEMSQTFAKLFIDNESQSMPPLKSLALYYEFRELTPIGTAGDALVSNLAERLVQVDLLDRAADLLNHQVRHRLEGEQRSRTGARLAQIYLMNQHPEGVLEALEASGYAANPEDLKQERALLGAEALVRLNRNDEALVILEGDFSTPAQKIRRTAYWNKQDWGHFIPLAEEYMGRRSDMTAALDADQGEELMRLALAYAFTGEAIQLKYLHDYFGPLMAENPYKDMFFFVTERPGRLDPNRFEQVGRELAKIRSYLAAN